MVGKPIIKGTRITVELILRLLAQGQPLEEILDNYPHLKRRYSRQSSMRPNFWKEKLSTL